MRIEHIGLWTRDLEKMKDFYEKYFDVRSGERYHNSSKKFTSYFLTFESGSRLELMKREDISRPNSESFGYAHLALAAGSQSQVDDLVSRLTNDGFELLNGPRTTGDGYYEAVIKDPEGNLIEVMAD
ncbi:VOC family protein [Alkalibacterium olivapovliticus]|uniref:Lactoylglutathione lyase n=1 Tax=Alkalibacterium olivapovliticus TaxID=99907 RepID=A0A2T0WA36_9LACT|nr:VOC family protein [Alkalibacterium olivapovliticus]PRY83585.1 lactoylglutathione lyase [Alkalibacterium olivapovliticus]